MSRISASGLVSDTRLNASSPSSAMRTLCPSSFSRTENIRAVSGRSSATTILKLHQLRDEPAVLVDARVVRRRVVELAPVRVLRRLVDVEQPVAVLAEARRQPEALVQVGDA